MSWLKSTRSDSWNSCVEVGVVDGQVQVRNSTDPDGPVLTLTAAYWSWVIGRVAVGAQVATITRDDTGIHWRNALDGWVVVDFSEMEWAAFVAGVVAGEFGLDRLPDVTP